MLALGVPHRGYSVLHLMLKELVLVVQDLVLLLTWLGEVKTFSCLGSLLALGYEAALLE